MDLVLWMFVLYPAMAVVPLLGLYVVVRFAVKHGVLDALRSREAQGPWVHPPRERSGSAEAP